MLEIPSPDDVGVSNTSIGVRLRLPWPEWFPPVEIHSPYGCAAESGYVYCKDNDVNLGKGTGDTDAAIRAVEKFISNSALEKITQHLCGRTTYVVAPSKPPEARRNVLSLAFAAIVAQELGLETTNTIMQHPRARRDKIGNFVFRLANSPTFYGEVIDGSDYVVVDDVLTYGGTLAGLRAYIECNGGRVICMSALAGNPSGSSQIALTPQSRSILDQYEGGALDSFFMEVLGYGLDCFTEREAGKLHSLLQKEWRKDFSLDALRARIIRARNDAATD